MELGHYFFVDIISVCVHGGKHHRPQKVIDSRRRI